MTTLRAVGYYDRLRRDLQLKVEDTAYSFEQASSHDVKCTANPNVY